VILLPIVSHKNNLSCFLLTVHDAVKLLNQSLSEKPTWRGPVSAIVEAEEIALASDLVLVELIKRYFCDTVVPLLSLSYEKFIAD
jgi:hypothetical protein